MDLVLIEWYSKILQREQGLTEEEADKRAIEDWLAFEKDMREGNPWQ